MRSRGHENPRRGIRDRSGRGWGPAASERRLRPCRAEAMEIRGEASAIGRGGGGAPPPVKKEGEEVILVVAEQRDGKLNRPTWETIVGAQQPAGASNVPIAALV